MNGSQYHHEEPHECTHVWACTIHAVDRSSCQAISIPSFPYLIRGRAIHYGRVPQHIGDIGERQLLCLPVTEEKVHVLRHRRRLDAST